MVNGRLRIRDVPPLVYHAPIENRRERRQYEDMIRLFFADYRLTLPDDRHALFDRYELVDVAMRVVGVGRSARAVTRRYSSHSGRRTFASRLLGQGHSIETVQLLLGHAHLDHVAPYLEVARKARHEAMMGLGGVFSEGWPD